MNWRHGWVVAVVALCGCGNPATGRSLEAAVAAAARELAPLHPFAAPQALVVDSSVAAHVDAAALSRALELPRVDGVRWDCPTDDPAQCTADPGVAAYLRIEGYDPDRDPRGRVIVTLAYYSLPPPFGENNYMLAHELFLEQTSEGWDVVEMRESAEG